MSKKSSLELKQFLPYMMVRLADRLSTTLATIYQRDYGISIAEWRVMANVYEHGELMSKAIASLTNMDKVKVSRAVQTLEEKGWIQKKGSAADNRAYFIVLTAKGKAMMKKMVPRVLTWQSELLKTVSKKELTVFLKTVAKLEQQLDKMA